MSSNDVERLIAGILDLAPSKKDLEKIPDDRVEMYKDSFNDMMTIHGEDILKLDGQIKAVFLQTYELILEEDLIRKARNDPSAFIEYIFVDDVTEKPLEQADMHLKWQRVMTEYKRSIIIAPRNHGKSTQIVGRALWELGRNPNIRIKIISNIDKNASKRVVELQKYIEKNKRLRKVFPNLKPGSRSDWNNYSFTVMRDSMSRDPSVEAYGIIASGTGGRCDFMILDDVVDRKNAITEPARRKQIKDAIRSDWLAQLSEGGKVVSICTLWHKDDFNNETGGAALRDFLKGREVDQSEKKPGEWYVCFDAVGEDYEPVWPEQWPRDRLEAKAREIGRSAFNRGYRNRVVDDTETMIEKEWIRYYEPGTLPSRRDLFILQSYDLAISEKKTAANSWFACVTMGVFFGDGAPQIYVMHAYRKRLTFPQQCSLIQASFTRHLKPDVIVLEGNAYQIALYQQLMDQTILPLVPMTSRIHKALRLEAASPSIERGNVLFSPRLNPDYNPALEKTGDLVSELTDFPFGESDDMVDAFSQGFRYIQEYSGTIANRDGYSLDEQARVYVLGEGFEEQDLTPSNQKSFEA